MKIGDLVKCRVLSAFGRAHRFEWCVGIVTSLDEDSDPIVSYGYRGQVKSEPFHQTDVREINESR